MSIGLNFRIARHPLGTPESIESSYCGYTAGSSNTDSSCNVPFSFGNLTRVFVQYAQDNGWRLIETLQLQLSKMVGLKHIGNGAFKTEPVYVFKKKP